MILIDILKDEYRTYQEMMYTGLTEKVSFVIPVVVFAELLPQFKGNQQETHLFLNDHKITIEPLDLESAMIAGKRWIQYLKKKGKVKCRQCGYYLDLKEHFLSDFFIGGFALATCDSILTRDRGIYKKYFPELHGYRNCI